MMIILNLSVVEGSLTNSVLETGPGSVIGLEGNELNFDKMI
jgi:hypothetical protein